MGDYTKWSVRADAIKASTVIRKLCQSIVGDKIQNSLLVHEARCLLKEENIIITGVLHCRTRPDYPNNYLTRNSSMSADLLKSLLNFLMSQWDIFDDFDDGNKKIETPIQMKISRREKEKSSR